jgi:hypothetical protein
VSIFNAPMVIWALVVATYLATIVFEWPFCYLALKKGAFKSGVLKASIHASVIVQTASYTILVLWFYFVSGKGLYTAIKTDHSLSFARHTQATIYFVSSKDGDIYKIGADGKGCRKVLNANIAGDESRLFVRLNKEADNWDFWVRGYPTRKANTLLIKDFVSENASSEIQAGFRDKDWPLYFGRPLDLRPVKQRDWTIFAEIWAWYGINARNEKTGKSLGIGLETPFLQWRSRYATILPGNKVVYQLGEDQIVMLDLESRKIGLIARGCSPVVTLNNPKE